MKMAEIPKCGAGRAVPGPGAGLSPVRLQAWAPGAALGSARPPGRSPVPEEILLWRSKDTVLIWHDFSQYSLALGLGAQNGPWCREMN